MASAQNEINRCTVRITLRLRDQNDRNPVEPEQQSTGSVQKNPDGPHDSSGSSGEAFIIPGITDLEAIFMARKTLQHYSDKFNLKLNTFNASKSK
ncbi:unnamed protein product [Bursaphelenchus okinawaensis]|uniref:Uncharacterized protein n=1 Tax=Bursaphelenchus okinawaensis TaxID=465554 RepID=A0A811K2Z8_9BILA|nr:unnamed protein product [Bursaphelenchus okinawaensis]CAG9090608.1 unnamed protein product [Bursaphelenchus okinawaensis]